MIAAIAIVGLVIILVGVVSGSLRIIAAQRKVMLDYKRKWDEATRVINRTALDELIEPAKAPMVSGPAIAKKARSRPAGVLLQPGERVITQGLESSGLPPLYGSTPTISTGTGWLRSGAPARPISTVKASDLRSLTGEQRFNVEQERLNHRLPIVDDLQGLVPKWKAAMLEARARRGIA